MFKKTIILSCLGSLSMFLLCFNSSSSSDGDNDEAMIIRKVRNTLTQMHYSSIAIDDKFSKEVFKKYLENIDPYKRFFLQSDFEEFKKNEEKMDDDFNSENLDFHNLVVNRYYERIEKTEKIVDEILKNPIDLNVDEYLILDEKQRTFAKDEKEHKKEWEKFIKYQMLNEIAILKEVKPRKDSLTKKPQKPKIALTFNQMKDSRFSSFQSHYFVIFKDIVRLFRIKSFGDSS